MKKYVYVPGCDKCHLGYIYYPCPRCDGMGCLYCRQGEIVEACKCNDRAWEIDFDIPRAERR